MTEQAYMTTHACLNPQSHHPVIGTQQTPLVCTVPQCGFLLAGAAIDYWRITKLLRHGDSVDLYLATAANEMLARYPRMFVRVLRRIYPKALPNLKQIFALQHPYIHPIQKVGWVIADQGLFLLQPFEERGSLARYVSTEGRLPVPVVVTLIRQIAEALQYTHERYIVHGRLKPENCLLVAPTTVQITDFYHASHIVDQQTGFSAFLAPEQLQGRVEPATDQYALALIAYQLFTGHHPFKGRSALSMPSYVPISILRPELPAQIDMIFQQALNNLPERRFSSILAFATALQGILSQRVSAPLRLNTTNPHLPSISGPNLPSISRPISLPEFASKSTPPPASIPTPPLMSTGGKIPTKASLICRLPGHTSTITALSWAPDGMHLVSSADQSLRFWRIKQNIGTPLTTAMEQNGQVLALHWSADNSLISSTTISGTVRTWKVPPGISALPTSEVAWWGHDGRIPALAWSADGTRLLTGGNDRTIRIWDRTGKALSAWRAHGRGGITAISWSPNNQLIASGGADRQLQIWDTQTKTQRLAIEAHTDEICHIAWSPDGTLLATSAGKKDRRVCLWNVQTGKLQVELQGAKKEIIGLFWGASGNWLAVASADNTLQFWSLMPFQKGQTITLTGTPVALAYHAAQNKVAFGTSDMQVQVFQLQ